MDMVSPRCWERKMSYSRHLLANRNWWNNDNSIGRNYTITHDYYDHRSAEQDLNVVLPLDRLAEMREAGYIGEIAKRHYGFMGHIVRRHVETLINESAPDVAKRLLKDNVDIVLLTPG